MANHVSIIFPDEVVHWFRDGESDRKAIGFCPHECSHKIQAVVAWGCDFEHYELVRCDDDLGCDGWCRGWQPVDDNENGGTDGPRYLLTPVFRVLDKPRVRASVEAQ